jgi:hypothetical protein
VKQILKRLFGTAEPDVVEPPPAKVESEPRPKRPRTPKPTLSAKELATERGEPYVNVIAVELDPDNIGAGAFELDWNDKFLANLVRAGYQKQPNEPEHVIVDRWFQDICRNVVLETYEQEQADPDLRRVSRRNLGDGRTEIS